MNASKPSPPPIPGEAGRRLADRLGMTVHQSVLERRLQRLASTYPSPTAACIEDWLLDVARSRGARVLERPDGAGPSFVAPTTAELPNEDLVVAICELQRADRPQLLRLAAQLVTRGAVNLVRLLLVARRERVEIVLGELARQALKVEPNHTLWRGVATAFPQRGVPRSPITHWQRLAWPTMTRRGVNAERWELVR